MTALSFADITDDDVRAVRQSHPQAFGDPVMRMVRIASWTIVIGYLLYSFHLFEFAKIFDPVLFTEACSAFGFLGVRGPGRPLSGALSRIW